MKKWGKESREENQKKTRWKGWKETGREGTRKTQGEKDQEKSRKEMEMGTGTSEWKN